MKNWFWFVDEKGFLFRDSPHFHHALQLVDVRRFMIFFLLMWDIWIQVNTFWTENEMMTLVLLISTTSIPHWKPIALMNSIYIVIQLKISLIFMQNILHLIDRRCPTSFIHGWQNQWGSEENKEVIENITIIYQILMSTCLLHLTYYFCS